VIVRHEERVAQRDLIGLGRIGERRDDEDRRRNARFENFE
jgi:hypothetical protein